MKKSRLEQWDIGHEFDIDRQPVKEVNLNRMQKRDNTALIL